jgi:hypothetical protein
MRANRLNPAFDAVYLPISNDSMDLSVPAREGLQPTDESGYAKTARRILKLALDLDVIEQDRREGRVSSWELAVRCISVWFAIKELDKVLDVSERRA